MTLKLGVHGCALLVVAVQAFSDAVEPTIGAIYSFIKPLFQFVDALAYLYGRLTIVRR